MSKRRIFIVSAAPGGNKGAEAMLETVIQKIRYFAAADEYEIWIEATKDSPVFGAFCDRIGLEKNVFRLYARRFGAPYSIQPSKGDVMIDLGGINYTENSTVANLRNLRRHNFFRSRGVQMIFFTQDFGPVSRLHTKMIARKIMGSARMVFSRSVKSLEILKQTVPNVKVQGPFPDCTLALKKTEPPQMPSTPFVVLVPSAIMVNYHEDQYLNFMVEIGKALPADKHVLVLAHNFTTNGTRTDAAVCKELHAALQQHRETSLIIEQWSPAELKGLLAGSDAVITSRFHAMVGAMACNVPAYSIGWSHKYNAFMSLYQLEHFSFDMKRLSQPGEDVAACAKEICDQVLNGVDRAALEAKNADLSARVKASFDALEAEIAAQ